MGVTHHDTEMVFDPTDPMIDHEAFERKDWASSEFGATLSEVPPDNMP